MCILMNNVIFFLCRKRLSALDNFDKNFIQMENIRKKKIFNDDDFDFLENQYFKVFSTVCNLFTSFSFSSSCLFFSNG
jgi:hypothetical protein